jgi:glycosyltransferase involved in cell wall biosynthesis
MVAIEAFAQGSPVIARDVGPFPEMLRRSGAGETFGTPAELDDILRRLLREPERRATFSASARQAVRQYWTEATVLPAYLDIVRRAALRRGLTAVTQALADQAA